MPVLKITPTRMYICSAKLLVEIFDPLKDFIRLPRAMRRQMSAAGNSTGLDKIIIGGPVLKVEVIAIYK